MKVGNYQIGRYYAIIKKIFEDGSFDYETSFENYTDLMSSVVALKHCINEQIGVLTDYPKVLVDIAVIQGRENVIAELKK